MSSPKKQSVPSGLSSPKPAAEALSSPHVEEPDHHDKANAQQHPVEGAELQQGQNEEYSPAQQDETVGSAPQPSFQPIFTVIEDTNSSEYHYPTVHYLFENDDPELVTEAALRSLESSQQGSTHGESQKQPTDREKKKDKGKDKDDGQQLDEENQRFSLPPPIPGAQEHFLILDVEPATAENTGAASTNPLSGAADPVFASPPPPPPTNTILRDAQNIRITAAHSLSPAWQVINTTLGQAPTFDSSSDHPTAPDDDSPIGGLMLKIQGTSGVSRYQSPSTHTRTIEDMMDQFSKRMGELKAVIEAGDDYEESHEPEQGQDQGDLDGKEGQKKSDPKGGDQA